MEIWKLYPGIMRKIPPNHLFWTFFIKGLIKKNSDKLLANKNTKHLLRNKFLRNNYNKRRITLSKAGHSSCLDCLCSLSFIFSSLFYEFEN